MTVLPSIYSNTTETAPMAELQKLKSKAQTSERRRQIRREHREASKMQETKKPDPEPHQTEKSKPNCMKQEVQAAQLLRVAVRDCSDHEAPPPDNVSCIPEDMVVLLDLPDGLV
ncbi:hypothetical protein PR001_g17170 [Phytophthora rubi]|uniref:Uncharacterized protein n=1 Tax=Phytophthora rubi TaxID=129364 RepID=A0A6A3JT56_9STRA|nr:hypothetical protein PR002_g18725 [Phytophthora rubi]KAE9006574.1 hypothetical protein PR001_g17170 [Phytophthora rubi]